MRNVGEGKREKRKRHALSFGREITESIFNAAIFRAGNRRFAGFASDVSLMRGKTKRISISCNLVSSVRFWVYVYVSITLLRTIDKPCSMEGNRKQDNHRSQRFLFYLSVAPRKVCLANYYQARISIDWIFTQKYPVIRPVIYHLKEKLREKLIISEENYIENCFRSSHLLSIQ